MKVACITGVTGFLGSHMARALVRLGWEVHGLELLYAPTCPGCGTYCRAALRSMTWTASRSTGCSRVGRRTRSFTWPPDTARQNEPPSRVVVLRNVVFPLALLERAVWRSAAT